MLQFGGATPLPFLAKIDQLTVLLCDGSLGRQQLNGKSWTGQPRQNHCYELFIKNPFEVMIFMMSFSRPSRREPQTVTQRAALTTSLR